MTLDDLGPRICIVGPSGSGKSTLAGAIARTRGLDAIYLDQLHHLPYTDWKPRPAEEFATLHEAAIAGSRWVMEGNYSRLLPQRLHRATGFILLQAPIALSLFRYFRRSWFERDRRGSLPGARDNVNWTMIQHISVTARAGRSRYQDIFDTPTLPKVRLVTTRAVNDFYRANGLRR